MKKIFLMGLAASLAFVASASAGDIFIDDHSFEGYAAPPIGDVPITVPPWVRMTGPSFPAGAGFVAQEGQAGMANIPDLNQAATPSFGAIWQDLAASYEDGVTYTLTALASARFEGATGALDAWSVELHDTSAATPFDTADTSNVLTRLAENSKQFDLIPSDQGPQAWQEISLQYTATGADDGNNIRVVFGTGSAPGSTNDFLFILDNVRLTDGGTPLLPGDVDESGFVNELDLEIILANFLITDPQPSRMQGNLNNDSTVNELDFLIWRTDFLSGGGSLEGLNISFPANVPEPSTVVLMAIGLMALVRHRRRSGVVA